MNAEQTKAKMDREVEIRKLLAKLDREMSGLQTTLKNLFNEVYNTTTSSCTIELSEDEADGFHGKSYAAYKEAETRSYEHDE